MRCQWQVLLLPFLHTKQVGMFIKVFFVFWQRRIKYYEHGQFKLYLFLLENQLTWLKVIHWLHNSSLKHFPQHQLYLSEVQFDKTYNKSQSAISDKSCSSSLQSQCHPSTVVDLAKECYCTWWSVIPIRNRWEVC